MQLVVVAKTFVLNGKNDVLLLKRSVTDDRRPGEWDLPGGSVDPGENPEMAAVREAEEEAGLQLDEIKLIHAQTELSEDTQQCVIRLYYRARVDDGSVRLSSEHEEYSWEQPSEALSLLTSQPQITALNDALRCAFIRR